MQARIVTAAAIGVLLCSSPLFAQLQFTYDYYARPHTPQSDSAQTFLYDANGNLTRRTNRSTGAAQNFQYNPANQIEKAVESGVEYRYDTSGTRIAKIRRNPDGTIQKIERYFGLIETDGTNRKKYYFFGSRRIAEKTQTGTITYHHSDNLNSATVATNATGTTLSRLDFYEFGALKSEEGTGGIIKYAYTGQERDAETNLYNYNARMYSSTIGKFTTADTLIPEIIDPQSLNRYSYVNNNPLKYRDPSGHMGFGEGVRESINGLLHFLLPGYAESYEAHADIAAGGDPGEAIESAVEGFMSHAGMDAALLGTGAFLKLSSPRVASTNAERLAANRAAAMKDLGRIIDTPIDHTPTAAAVAKRAWKPDPRRANVDFVGAQEIRGAISRHSGGRELSKDTAEAWAKDYAGDLFEGGQRALRGEAPMVERLEIEYGVQLGYGTAGQIDLAMPGVARVRLEPSHSPHTFRHEIGHYWQMQGFGGMAASRSNYRAINHVFTNELNTPSTSLFSSNALDAYDMNPWEIAAEKFAGPR